MSYTSIDLLRVTKPEQGEKLAAAIQNTTYLRLQVVTAPDGGEWQVSVYTAEDCTADELREMVLAVLAGNVAFGS